MDGAARAAAYLGERIADGTIPGASYLVTRSGRVVAEGALGHAVLVPEKIPAATSTLYDLASLTKPLVCGLLAVLLERHGRIRLEDPLWRHLPTWRTGDDRDRITPLDLLVHRSGLPAWLPLYLDAPAGDRWGRVARLARTPLVCTPGAGVTYSDPGYILLGFALEAAGGGPLDRLFHDLVTGPLRIDDLLFRPGERSRTRVAATEEGNDRERQLAGASGDRYNGWRTGVIRGEVHDHNAWTLGGVSGHSGLFGTAHAVHRIAEEFLGLGAGLLTPAEIERFRSNLTPGLEEDRSIGFQIATTGNSSAGAALSAAAIGHTGFTGTSLWIDPEGEATYVLLTNRVHPRYREVNMNAVRRGFHEAVGG